MSQPATRTPPHGASYATAWSTHRRKQGLTRIFKIIAGASILAGVIYVVWIQPAHHAARSLPSTWHLPIATDAGQLDLILNKTLGFQEVFVVNLPARSDRRDAIALAGALTDLQFQYVDGIDGKVILDKVLPTDSANHTISPGNKGSWRAHVNALRSIVERNLATALVLEDDVDWDVRIHAQLQQFARATLAFTQSRQSGLLSSLAEEHMPRLPLESTDTTRIVENHTVTLEAAPRVDFSYAGPYGDKWDVLWIGHCGTEFPAVKTDVRSKAQFSLLRITIPDDPSVPAPEHLKPHPFALADALAEQHPPHTRVVHAASGTLCTQAYAVSQAGARKLLFQLGIESLTTGYDLMLRDWCDGVYLEHDWERRPLCVTVQPPLFSHFLFDKEASSDINAQGGGFLHKAGSQYIRLSVRKNFRRLLAKVGLDKLEDQWPDPVAAAK